MVLMVSVGQTIQNNINRELQFFGGNKFLLWPGWTKRGSVSGARMQSALRYGDYEAIAKLKGVRLASAYYHAPIHAVHGSKNADTYAEGVTFDYFEQMNYKLAEGELFRDANDGTVAVLGYDTAKRLFGEDEDPLGATIRLGNIPFRVIGILEEKGSDKAGTWDDTIIVPLFTLKQRLGRNKIPDALEAILVTADNDRVMFQVMKKVEVLLQERHKLKLDEENDFQIVNLKEEVETSRRIAKALSLLLAFISFILLAVGTMGIMNTMLISVAERTREIGVRKAIGARDEDIMLQFLFEPLLLSLLGGITGMLLGIVITKSVAYYLNYTLSIGYSMIVISLLASLLVGILAGIIPARKATRLNPTEALRG